MQFCNCTFLFKGEESITFESVDEALGFVDEGLNQHTFSSASIDAVKDGEVVTFWFGSESATVENLMYF